MRTELRTPDVPVTPGDVTVIEIEVANTSDVIDGVTARVEGIDPSWVHLPVPGAEPVPGVDRGAADPRALPADHRRRRLPRRRPRRVDDRRRRDAARTTCGCRSSPSRRPRCGCGRASSPAASAATLRRDRRQQRQRGDRLHDDARSTRPGCSTARPQPLTLTVRPGQPRAWPRSTSAARGRGSVSRSPAPIIDRPPSHADAATPRGGHVQPEAAHPPRRAHRRHARRRSSPCGRRSSCSASTCCAAPTTRPRRSPTTSTAGGVQDVPLDGRRRHRAGQGDRAQSTGDGLARITVEAYRVTPDGERELERIGGHGRRRHLHAGQPAARDVQAALHGRGIRRAVVPGRARPAGDASRGRASSRPRGGRRPRRDDGGRSPAALVGTVAAARERRARRSRSRSPSRRSSSRRRRERAGAASAAADRCSETAGPDRRSPASSPGHVPVRVEAPGFEPQEFEQTLDGGADQRAQHRPARRRRRAASPGRCARAPAQPLGNVEGHRDERRDRARRRRRRRPATSARTSSTAWRRRARTC